MIPTTNKQYQKEMCIFIVKHIKLLSEKSKFTITDLNEHLSKYLKDTKFDRKTLRSYLKILCKQGIITIEETQDIKGQPKFIILNKKKYIEFVKETFPQAIINRNKDKKNPFNKKIILYLKKNPHSTKVQIMKGLKIKSNTPEQVQFSDSWDYLCCVAHKVKTSYFV